MTKRRNTIRNHIIISLVIIFLDYFIFRYTVYGSNLEFLGFNILDILAKLILGNVFFFLIYRIIKNKNNEGKDIIHNMISDLSLNGIERFLKLTYYVFIFLIINTIIDFIKLINESGEYLTFKHYIYYIFGLFGLFSWLLLVNYVLRTRK